MNLKASILAALERAGEPMSRAELAEALQIDGNDAQLAKALHNMAYVDQIVRQQADGEPPRYVSGPKADTVRRAAEDAGASPDAARTPREAAAKRSPRKPQRTAPPAKRSRAKRATPPTSIIHAPARPAPAPDRAGAARDLAAGLVGNVARSATLLRVVLDSELAKTTPTIAAALEQLDAAVSLCATGLRASGGGA